MKNKVLVRIIVPEMDESYDVFLPVNDQVWKINKLIMKSIYDMNGLQYNPNNDNYVFINKTTGVLYKNNNIIYDTDIRNGTELISIKVH